MRITIKRKGKGASMRITAQTEKDRKELTEWIMNGMGSKAGKTAEEKKGGDGK